MISIIKTPDGYWVNDKFVIYIHPQLIDTTSLNPSEKSALDNFMHAEASGLKISSSCVKP
jgi:hypothetical protein